MAATVDGELILVTNAIVYNAANMVAITHRINLFLEIFGECHVFTENLERIIQAPVRRLHWRLLPPGRRPFGVLPARQNRGKGDRMGEVEFAKLKELQRLKSGGP